MSHDEDVQGPGDAEKTRKKRGPRGGASKASISRALAVVTEPEVLADPESVLAWEADFLKALRSTAMPKEAAALTGIDLNIVFRWRRESERFELLYQQAKEEGVELILESEAFRRAVDKSDLLMLGALNAYMPGRYKRDQKTTKFAGNGIVLEISDAQ